MDDDLLIIGGMRPEDKPDTYWIRDRLGSLQVEKAVIDHDPSIYQCLGRLEFPTSFRNYYVLKADPPL